MHPAPELSNDVSLSQDIPNIPKTPDNQRDVRETSDGGNIEQIRDILFGKQMRDYEERFSLLEERVMQEAADLREESRKRFDSLETFIRQEIVSLDNRLKADRDERADCDAQLSRELRELSVQFDKRFADLESRNAQDQREVRQQLYQQGRTLTDELQRNYEELARLLDQKVRETRDSMTHRSVLAGLLTEVALRLHDGGAPAEQP